MDPKLPIGVFDSGIGGLTVVREVGRLLPAENLIYLGDTARVPYGTKSAQTIERYTRESVRFLLDKKVKMIVVACNTATAFALASVKKDCPVPILGVIEPGARGAVAKTRNNRIGVIGTEGTIRSGAYEREIQQLNPAIEVTSSACPLFVPFVEEGWLEGEATRLVAGKYLAPLEQHSIDTLVLGCTNYPLLKPVLQEILKDVTLIDSAEATAAEVRETLTASRSLCPGKAPGNREFFVTDSPKRFRRVGEIFMGEKLSHVLQVEI